MRPLTGREEIDLFTSAFPYVLDSEVLGDLDAGRRRLDWLWLALRDGIPVARAGFWSRSGETPMFLDLFDMTDGETEVGAELVRRAKETVGGKVEYVRFLPPDWRDDPASVEGLMRAMELTGARLFVERLRLQWQPGTPIPEPSGRLEFRPVRDREELVGLMTEVLEGTLDAHSLAGLASKPAAQVAAEQYDGEFQAYLDHRGWWRVAQLPGGAPVGFVIPSRNSYNAIIAYIGVLPAHRGNGYIADILAEGTRVLAGEGVERIRASTDVGNVPMARAFDSQGYVTFQHQIDMIWP